MDNEEKFNQAGEEQNSRPSESAGGVHYKKVNVYSGGRAFDRNDNRGSYRGGSYGRERDNSRGYNSYRNRDNNYRGEGYRQGGGSYRYDNNGGGYGRGGYGGYDRQDRYVQERPGRGYSPAGRSDYSRGSYGGGYNDRNDRYGDSRPQRDYGERRSGRYEYQPRRNSYGAPRPQRQNNYGGSYNPDAKYSVRKRIQYAEENFDPEAPIRLNKFLSNAGVCSRRDADKFITAGVVTVNGEVVTELGTKIKRSDVVKFNNETVSIEKKVYVLLNKPKDYVTTSDDPQNRKTVMDLVKGACRERIYPVGRLDRNTTGVLLLTNDGELASKLTHPKYKKKKIYHAYLDHNVAAADMQQIANGVMLEDGEVHADAIEYASPTDKKQVGIEIHSGKNRIVRRIFESLGYHVTKLDRVYFAGLTKKNLRRGQWRYLSQEEVNYLKMGEFE